MGTVKLLRSSGLPILRQLQIEEALLRASTGNWCLLNDGCSPPAIVMGISGKAHELIHEPAARRAAIQVIKRFTGGGTVVVDEQTLFATLIMQAESLPDVACYPREIMRWSSEFYGPIFAPHGNFNLRDQDYAFGSRKFGGNAQAITKQRWLHHTSFLWDFDVDRMELLKHPLKTPQYREGRGHHEFVCRLKDVVGNRAALFEGVPRRLAEIGFDVQEASFDEAEVLLKREYLRGNRVVDLL